MKALYICGNHRGSLIDIYVRGEDSKKHKLTIIDFRPYLYVPNDYGESTAIFGESVTKQYVNDPSDVPKEREKHFHTWEADVPYVRRFLIDKTIYKGLEFPERRREISASDIMLCEVNIEPLILYFDIEVLPEEGVFPVAEKAAYPVISISYKFSNNPLYFTYVFKEGERERIIKKGDWIISYYTSEKKLLIAFYDLIEKYSPDILNNWNISKYDYPYLKNRFKKLSLQWIDESSFEIFDEYFADKKIYRRRRHGLKQVAKEEGIVKNGNPETFSDVIKYYYTDLYKFLNYSRNDVEYVFEIEKKLGLMKHFYEFKYLAGVEDINDTFKTSVTIDTLLLRIAKDICIVLPTKTEKEEGERYEGAYVFAGDAGLYNDVIWFDFASYYPSIINSFYLSPENIIDGCEIKDFSDDTIYIEDYKDVFIGFKKTEGIIQKLLGILLAKKAEVTKLMKSTKPGSEEYKSLYRKREAVKGQINTTYGVMAYKGFRLFEPGIASATTKIGREGLKLIIKVAEEYGYKVLLADTDSIMVQMPFEKRDWFSDILNKRVKEYFKERYNVDVSINLEFDKNLKGLLLTGVKKRYAYRCVFENDKECDYTSAKGFENIRTDQSKFTQDLLDDLFDLILYEKGEKEIRDFINNKLEEFPKRSLNEIAISKQINKPLNKYKANVPHVRGALYSNAVFGTNFMYGSKPMMLWVKAVPRKPQTNVVCFDDDTELPEIVVDWEKMKNVCIIQKIKPILDAIGVDLSGSFTKQMRL